MLDVILIGVQNNLDQILSGIIVAIIIILFIMVATILFSHENK